jgi:RHS repeat-associated protein
VDTTVGLTTTITRYAYDMWNPAKAGATGTSGSDIWATFTSGGSLTMRELQGDEIDQHLAYVTSSSAYWYLTDHLNSVRAVLNSDGSVNASVAYDAYDNLTTAAAPGLYDWTGREFDVETGLQYNRVRYYDPGTGRWISQDPMGFDAGDSNLYRYVNNRPATEADPSGLQDNRLGVRLRPPKGAGDPFNFPFKYDVDKKFLGGFASLHAAFDVSGQLIRVGNPQSGVRIDADYNAGFTLEAAVEKVRPVLFGKVIFHAGVKVQGQASGDLDATVPGGPGTAVRVSEITGNATLRLRAEAGITFEPSNGQPASDFSVTITGTLTLNNFDFSGLEVRFPQAQGQNAILQNAPLFSFGKVTGSFGVSVARTIRGRSRQTSTSNYTPIDETTTTTSKFTPIE